jgi:predicted GNAT family acetyltransferase
MQLITYPTAADFLARTRTELEENEAANSLMLGICLRLEKLGNLMKTPLYFATVEDAAGIVVAAILQPPYRLLFYSPRSEWDEALELIGRHLLENNWTVPGALGPVGIVETFVATWEKLSGQKSRLQVRERLFELREVKMPERMPPGHLRIAETRDIELIAKWAGTFMEEALAETPTEGEALRLAEGRVKLGEIFLWEDEGQVVSMAAKGRPTRHSYSIGLVYTPPELRGRGYASACVASLSQAVLDSGYQFCTLFTDLSNPISNSIYQKMGYRPLGDFNAYDFEV